MKINNYTEFVNEYYNREYDGKKTRTDNITEDEFLEIYRNRCKNFNPSTSTLLFRGSDNKGEFLSIDPAKFSRGSIENVDVHTFLMDNMVEWSKFPKRSSSVIASTSSREAGAFGDTTYVVIPYDMVGIGICPEKDVWTSYEKGEIVSYYNEFSGESTFNGYSSNSFLKQIYYFINEAGLEFRMDYNKEYTIDYDTFLSFFKHGFNIKRFGSDEKELSENKILSAIKFVYGLNTFSEIDGDIALRFISDSFDPVANKFKANKYRKNLNIPNNGNEGNAVWIGGECLLLEYNTYLKIKSKLTK